ncbi:MAG: serine O-acetyltransferase, partial [Pseudomonadota bacterium]
MALSKPNLQSVDPLWSRIRTEAEEVTHNEPLMAAMVHSGILYHTSLASVLSFRLAQKLASGEMSELILR